MTTSPSKKLNLLATQTIGQLGDELAFFFLKRRKWKAALRARCRRTSPSNDTRAFFSSAANTNPQDIARVELTILEMSDVLNRVSAKQRARTIKDSEWGDQLEED